MIVFSILKIQAFISAFILILSKSCSIEIGFACKKNAKNAEYYIFFDNFNIFDDQTRVYLEKS